MDTANFPNKNVPMMGLRTGIKDIKVLGSKKSQIPKFGREAPECLAKEFTDVRKPPIRSSAMRNFEHCPRKFLYQSRLGIAPRLYQSSLHIGRVFHLVLQALFTGAEPEDALKVVASTLSKVNKEILDSVDAAGFTQDGKPIEKVIAQMNEDSQKGQAMAAAFMSFHPFDWSKWDLLYTPTGQPCVELLLQTLIPGISVPIVTPCDLALLKKESREVWIVDHKSTGADTLSRSRSVKISAQMALYRLVLQSHLDEWTKQGERWKDLQVVGSIHNIVKKPSIKYCPSTKDKDGFGSYIQRVTDWYKETHEKDPKHSPIFQSQTRFTEPVLTEEFYLRLQQLARASSCAPNLERFYRAGDYACHEFNSVCPYADLCASHPSAWPDIVKTRFDIRFREDEEES